MTQQNRPFAIPFHSGDGLGCNYYRIPALITTQQGVTIAAMDAASAACMIRLTIWIQRSP